MDRVTMYTADMELEKEVQMLLRANRRVTNDFHYTVPSPETYPYQWMWDSCFHAIIYSYFDIDSAKDELRSLVSKQFDNGMLPHMIYWNPGTVHVYDWGKEQTSSITQPPLIAYSVWKIFEKDDDKSFLEELYPSLKNFYRYLIEARDPRDHHLAGIINPDESGEDNSPRFDMLLDLPPKHSLEENLRRRMVLIGQNKDCRFDAELCMKQFFWVKDVPFNVILVEGLTKLSNISHVLGRDDDAHYFDMHAKLISQAMFQYMYEDGIFWSTYGESYTKIKVKTWAIFAPLFAGLYSEEDARKVISLLDDPCEFGARYLVPTVSLSEESYDSHPQEIVGGYWRGPVWIGTNWFIYHGLKKYGYKEKAEKVKASTIELLTTSGFREKFVPETGEGLGAKDFTWGGLVLDMR